MESMLDVPNRPQKAHRAKKSGRKAEKKAKKNEETKKISQAGMTPRQKNPKAFAIQNVKKMEKFAKRTCDIRSHKVHIPVVDRTPVEPPPIVVAIVGPAKVGKSTLLKGIVKNFTKRNLKHINGPVTVVSQKTRRLTLIECNNDMNSMIDIAKVADVVLLLMDASFGMEMETFEFLNICQVHGFPRVMGVLTHLDYFKNPSKARKQKRLLKHRFWKEVHMGAKLFYISGMVNEKMEYLSREVFNLCRFLNLMKFRPLTWRNTHPYVLADRMEDITDPETARLNPKQNRTVCLYGYMRGLPLKNHSTVHIPGCGDFLLKDVSFLPDPCPLPTEHKKRKLNEKETKLFAPMSGVGGIVYDKDAVYIELGSNAPEPMPKKAIKNYGDEKDDDDESDPEMDDMDLKSAMVSTQNTLDQKIAKSQLSVFKNSETVTSEEFVSAQQGAGELPEFESVKYGGRIRRRAIFNTPDEELEESSDEDNDEDVEHHITMDAESDQDEEYAFESEEEEDAHTGKEKWMKSEEAPVSWENTYTQKTKTDTQSFSSDLLQDTSVNEEMIDDGSLRWKANLATRAALSFLRRQNTAPNLRKLVYDNDSSMQSKDKEEDSTVGGLTVGGLFKVAKKSNKDLLNDVDSTRLSLNPERDWHSEETLAMLKDCFKSGQWESSKDAKSLLDQDDELMGEFRDLENEDANNYTDSEDDTSSAKKRETNKHGKKRKKEQLSDEETDSDDEEGPERRKGQPMTAEERISKAKIKREARKQRMKEMFDDEYDKLTGEFTEGTADFFDKWKAGMNAQAKLNRTEFADLDDELRVQLEGFRSGMYVRMEINNMPCEFVEHFDPTCPLIVGGVTSSECVIGCLQVRFKRHRWYKKILKTRDPIIFSLGWRRFQSMPLYTMKDHNGRNRLLKYTPEHMHCYANLWGPVTPQNTGILCVQSFAEGNPGFRIAATGVVLELDKSLVIMKKLKLMGYPYEIHKNTAFIKDMFNSHLEVAKFEGAKIRSVSGVRGQVKKGLKTPEGAFRATFEDKLLMSDIVFIRTWYSVDVPQFYNPVTTMLMAKSDRSNWQGMRTLGMIRKDKKLVAPFVEDSQYQAVAERKPHLLKPLVIPAKLKKKLPFQSQLKKDNTWIDPVLKESVAVIRDQHEKQRDKFLQSANVVYTSRTNHDRKKRLEFQRDRARQLREEQKLREEKRRLAKKHLFKELGKLKDKDIKTYKSKEGMS